MSELTFLQRCGAFVEAKEYVDLLQLQDRVNLAALTTTQFPTERNLDMTEDLAWRYVTEVDRLYKPASDQEEDYLADFALSRLLAIKGNLGVFDAPESEEE